MAGAAQQVTLDELGSWASRVNGEMDRWSFEKPLKQIAVLIAGETKRNFAAGADPDGNIWKPLKRPRTLPKSRRKAIKKRRLLTGKTDKPLRNKGLLMASVTAGTNPNQRREITARQLIFGTNLHYGPYHQFGTKYIPIRRFLGLNERILQQAEEILADFMAKKISQSR